MNTVSELRRRLNLLSYEGLERVANSVGCHTQTLARLRRGETKNPGRLLIKTLASHYGIAGDSDSGNLAANNGESKNA